MGGRSASTLRQHVDELGAKKLSLSVVQWDATSSQFRMTVGPGRCVCRTNRAAEPQASSSRG